MQSLTFSANIHFIFDDVSHSLLKISKQYKTFNNTTLDTNAFITIQTLNVYDKVPSNYINKAMHVANKERKNTEVMVTKQFSC